jgi:hypothetical protein
MRSREFTDEAFGLMVLCYVIPALMLGLVVWLL